MLLWVLPTSIIRATFAYTFNEAYDLFKTECKLGNEWISIKYLLNDRLIEKKQQLLNELRTY